MATNKQPNLKDERTLASFIDLIGTTLHIVRQEIADGELTEDGVRDLDKIHSILVKMRECCGVGTEWHRANLCMETIKHLSQPTPAEVAEQILADLNRD